MDLSYHGLNLSITDNVYPPAEDSFLLAEGAENLAGKVLEVGCGSGIASLCCAKARPSNDVLGVDINPEAVLCARKNAEANSIGNARFKRSDLFSGVRGAFDAILFNPPYLPTSEAELLEGPLNHAFDGGPDGRVVLERFLAGFDRRLKPGGTLLLVQSSLNDERKTLRSLRSLGYRPKAVREERFFFERLFLIKAVKPCL